jgi:hypothetical protein
MPSMPCCHLALLIFFVGFAPHLFLWSLDDVVSGLGATMTMRRGGKRGSYSERVRISHGGCDGSLKSSPRHVLGRGARPNKRPPSLCTSTLPGMRRGGASSIFGNRCDVYACYRTYRSGTRKPCCTSMTTTMTDRVGHDQRHLAFTRCKASQLQT